MKVDFKIEEKTNLLVFKVAKLIVSVTFSNEEQQIIKDNRLGKYEFMSSDDGTERYTVNDLIKKRTLTFTMKNRAEAGMLQETITNKLANVSGLIKGTAQTEDNSSVEF